MTDHIKTKVIGVYGDMHIKRRTFDMSLYRNDNLVGRIIVPYTIRENRLPKVPDFMQTVQDELERSLLGENNNIACLLATRPGYALVYFHVDENVPFEVE